MAMGAPHANIDADITTTMHTGTNTDITASPTPTTTIITHHYPKTSLGALHPLPPELIQHILFLLTAHTPLGPPTQLAPVRLASRALRAHATSAALLARVCRFKFDVGAVRRRCFEPGLEDLKAQLELGCRVLRGVRRGLVRLLEEEEDALNAGAGRGGDRTRARRMEDRGYDDADWEDWDGDMTDEDTLFGALLLMLDNDGKNYAQLEHAGVHAYVERFVLRRLWARARENAGWPVEDAASACALWVMWLTTDRARLVAESPRDRENIVLSILPFVFLTHRYPASEAPPNHFHLPLRDTAHAASGPLPWAPRTAFYPPREREHGRSAYDDDDTDADADDNDGEEILGGTSNRDHHDHQPQHYPHYLPTRAFLTPYFRALPELTPPLASTAAKLLFVSRREVRPFGIPQHLPRDREDAVRRWWVAQVETVRAMTAQVHLQGIANASAASAAMNANPTATAAVGLTLDEIQQAMHLPIPPMPAHVTPPMNLGPTQADYRALNRGKAAPLPRGARWDWEVGRARGVNEDPEADVDDDGGGGVDGGMSRTMRSRAHGGVDEEESRKWDTLWWRMRLCGDFRAPQPRFVPGAVFERGCMRGMWLGKIYIPQGHLQVHLIRHNPPYPGLPDARGLFSEASLGMVMQPVFMDMEEHVKVCGCASSSVSVGRRSSSDVGRTVGENERHGHGQCGVIPVPPPSGIADWRGVPFAGVLPADLPAGHPQHGPPPPLPVVAPAVVPILPANANAQNANANANAQNANAQNANVQNANVQNANAQNPNQNPNNETNDDPNDPTEPNPTTTAAGGAALDSSREHTQRPRPLDYSMSNAWLPGGIGDLVFAKRSVRGGGGSGAGIPLVVRGKGGRLEVVEVVDEGEEGLRRRDELVVSTTGREPDLLRARGCGAFELHALSASSLSSTVSANTSSSSSSSRSTPTPTSNSTPTPSSTPSSTTSIATSTTPTTPPHLPDAVPEECYVYETYDPAKISLHDIVPEAYSYAGPSRSWVTGGDAGRGVGVVRGRVLEGHGGNEGEGCDEIATHEIVNPHCARCVEREEERRKERAREGRRAVRALERRAAAAVNASAAASAAAGSTGAAKREIGAEARGVSERAAKRRRVGEGVLGAAAVAVSSSEAVSSTATATSPMSTTTSTPTTSTSTTPTPTTATTAAARAAEGQRQLEALMRVYRRPDASGEGSSFGDVDVDVDMDASVEELDVTGFGLRMEDEDVEMDVEEGRGLDLDEGEEEYEEDFSSEEDESSEEEDDDDDENDLGRQIDVLGDDIPHGHPGIWTASPSSPLPKRKYIPRTRREYARARITSIPSPCTHAADTLFTGHTPACGLAWGQRYTTYGRLRPWDGLVGLVRVGRSPVNFIFIFGYVVGGGTFVGEWRVAASDPMRPAWGGAFVMSRVGG